MTPNILTLYGAPPSLYTAKVRSCLRKNSIAFEERFQSHPDYRHRILPAAQNHRIPVVQFADGQVVQDSTLILDEIERRYPDLPVPTGALRIIELFLEAFAERSLLKAAMHYRWNFPEENGAFIIGEFGRILRHQDPSQWESAGKSIANRMNAYLPPLGITPETIPAIEGAYLTLLDDLNAHFIRHPYLLGNSPSRADYGLMGPLFAHLGRDPYPLRIMQQRATLVFRWVERMNAPDVRTPEFPDLEPGYVTPDALPETMVRVLSRAAAEYVPELTATAAAFENWCQQNPGAASGAPVSDKGQDQPSFGPISYEIGGRMISQASSGHLLWMNQRIQDAFAALQQSEKSMVSAIFSNISAASVLTLQLPRRLSRLQNRLSLA